GVLSAANAGPSSSKTRQRTMSKDLEAGCFGLTRQQVLHANLPSARRVIDCYRNEPAGATFRRQQIAGVIADRLPGWIYHIDMQDMIRRRCRRGKAQAKRCGI